MDASAITSKETSRDQSPLRELSIEEIISQDALEPVYQPVVDLYTDAVVAFEGLIRGPSGSRLERPDQLFGSAAAAGLTTELDWACRAAVIGRAHEAGLGKKACLFVNAEPSTFGTPQPSQYDAVLGLGNREMTIVIEVTERHLLVDPFQLMNQVRSLRKQGYAIAIDDLGANPETLALLPFLEPDLIKLDMSLVREYGTSDIAAIAGAVRADSERRGAVVLAEGIETARDVDRAKVLGATHGQGWFYGRPGQLDPDTVGAELLWDLFPRGERMGETADTPWDLVDGTAGVLTSTKKLLMPISDHLESYAMTQREQPVVLSAFQHARHFTPATSARYVELSKHCAVLGALGEGLELVPAPGVRGGSISADSAVAGEWTVTVLGPHFAAALIAKDRGDQGQDTDRQFDYVVTYDRAIVTAAAKTLFGMLGRAEAV